MTINEVKATLDVMAGEKVSLFDEEREKIGVV